MLLGPTAMRFENVHIDSIAHVLPEEVITSESLELRIAPLYERLNLSVGRLELMSGIRERRFWPVGTRPSSVAARAGAAVKADCYGLGVDRCLPVLHEAGCRDFFVAHWSEVPGVIAHVPANRVAVLHGPQTPEDAAFARETGVRPVIDSLRQARLWGEAGGGPCDLMIDSGINRLGIAPEELADPAVQALDVHTLLSHLACADEDVAMNARQLAVFRECLPAIAHRQASLANSAGIALGSYYAFDLTRPGLALYGGVPRPELAGRIASAAPLAVEAVMAIDRATRHLPLGEAFGHLRSGDLEAYERMLGSEDAEEGPRAFAEKRNPYWQGA